eukprot:5660086-Amphidinium_carterae.1
MITKRWSQRWAARMLVEVRLVTITKSVNWECLSVTRPARRLPTPRANPSLSVLCLCGYDFVKIAALGGAVLGDAGDEEYVSPFEMAVHRRFFTTRALLLLAQQSSDNAGAAHPHGEA